MLMLKGRASGGPRDNVTLEAGSDWDGIVHKPEYRTNRVGMRPYYPGRYCWETDHWQWHPGQYVRTYGTRGGKRAGNWIWINDSTTLEEREALLSVNVRPPTVYSPPVLVDRTRGVVDKTVNTITYGEPLPSRHRGRPVTHVLWSKTCQYCGNKRKYYRKTCGATPCMTEARRITMKAK